MWRSATTQAAWRAFVRALAVAPRVLDADLGSASRLNMADYHVLVLLSEPPERAMRMNELAAEAILTPSGLTRVVERLILAAWSNVCDHRQMGAAMSLN